MEGLRVGLVIPVFNVEKTIRKVLERVETMLLADDFEILIIDNHSGDDTLPIIYRCLAESPALAAHVTLIQHSANYGYGCSIKAGFEYFCERDVTHIMVIHGDHQVDPAWLIGRLLEPIKTQSNTDLVLGSRFERESSIENYSLLRRLGNYFFNAVTTFCSGHKMSDSGTAMIIVRREVLERIPFQKLSNTWQFHPQLNILLFETPGIRTEEIAMDWADSDAKSTVPLFRYGMLLLKMLTSYWAKKNLLSMSPADIFTAEPVPFDRRFQMVSAAADGAVVQEAAILGSLRVFDPSQETDARETVPDKFVGTERKAA